MDNEATALTAMSSDLFSKRFAMPYRWNLAVKAPALSSSVSTQVMLAVVRKYVKDVYETLLTSRKSSTPVLLCVRFSKL